MYPAAGGPTSSGAPAPAPVENIAQSLSNMILSTFFCILPFPCSVWPAGGPTSSGAPAPVENIEVIKLVMPIMECHTDIVRGVKTNELGTWPRFCLSSRTPLELRRYTFML
jgi:hypothetical protein